MTQQPFTTLGAVWGAAAGVMNAIALILYYQALSNSPASIIAPIVASSSAVPVSLSVLRGTVPSTLTMTGLLAVFIGVIITTMASGNEADRHQEIDVPPPCRGFIFRNWQPRYFRWIPSTCILFAIASSLVFGLFFIIFEQGSASSPAGRVWVTFGVQSGTIPITLLSAIFIQKVKRFAPAKAFFHVYRMVGDSAEFNRRCCPHLCPGF
ncbi:MAG: hypothetical protein HC919_14210 [Oscillatoriales cyanobacterium SM2_2_1]|nr:hypothetical protein [Oscillatoriales cyanobacterium SM2_2_1]